MGLFDSMQKLVTSEVKNNLNNFESVKDLAPNQVGVYIMSHKGKVMYVGRAIEDRPNQSPKGLRKRLQEHWRGATAGKAELYQYRSELNVQIRPCKSVDEAKQLEAKLIREHDAVDNGWNERYP